MNRRANTWLVVTTLSNAHGHEIALFGKASYDEEVDLLTVTSLTPTKGLQQVTQAGGFPIETLAKHLLRALFP